MRYMLAYAALCPRGALSHVGLPSPRVSARCTLGRPRLRHRLAFCRPDHRGTRSLVSGLPAMKRVLVTGASGFLGLHALPVLAARGFEVHATSLRKQPVVPGVRWHQSNLLDEQSIARLIAEVRVSHLLHLAWCAVPGRFWTAPENLLWAGASLNLIRAFRDHGGERVVVAGTCAEYDWHAGPCREDTTPIRPATVYGRCKHATQ